MEDLQETGFCIIKNLVPSELVTLSFNKILVELPKLAQELNVSTADYLHCTGRWGPFSYVTKSISEVLDTTIQSHLENLLQCQVQILQKSNIICKTADLVDPIPFHQDISYSVGAPYHFSVWLALNDVSITSGALQIVEGSHKWEIEPLVDFWCPYFSDKFSEDRQNYKIQTLPVSAGDGIVFDSRLWHGSDKNFDAKNRFAFVTRWLIKDTDVPSVPGPKSSEFGILNCGRITESILSKYLLFLNKTDGMEAKSLEELINTWITILGSDTVNAQVNAEVAVLDLQNLQILNQAIKLHNAGDIAGKIYKHLWFSLLVFLNEKLNIVTIKPEVHETILRK